MVTDLIFFDKDCVRFKVIDFFRRIVVLFFYFLSLLLSSVLANGSVPSVGLKEETNKGRYIPVKNARGERESARERERARGN